MRRRGTGRVGLLGLVLTLGLPAVSHAWPQVVTEALTFKARAHFLTGEMARIDLKRRLLVVKPDGETKEMDIAVDDSTRLTSGGRTLPFERLRAGDRVAVSCSDGQEGEHLARVVAVRGPARRAPSPAASPSASPKS